MSDTKNNETKGRIGVLRRPHRIGVLKRPGRIGILTKKENGSKVTC